MTVTIIHTDQGAYFEQDMPESAKEDFTSVIHIPDATTFHRHRDAPPGNDNRLVAHIVMNQRKSLRLMLNAEQLYATAKTHIWDSIHFTTIII